MAKKVKSIRMDEEALNTLNDICSTASKIFGAKISINYMLESFISEGMCEYCKMLYSMASNKEWADRYLKNTSQEQILNAINDLTARSEGYAAMLDNELSDNQEG